MTKHYVEFMYPGSFYSDTSIHEITSRDAKITLPKGAYAYRIFDREEIQHAGEILKGKSKNQGPRHIWGEEYDVERVEREVPDSRILVQNMKGNDWPIVIKCRQGFIPKEEGDIVHVPKKEPCPH
jgi:hypothetical protein